MPRKKTTEKFVADAEAVHGKGKFDYSNSVWEGGNIPTEIKCSKGHTFKQRPNDHLRGHGCPYCAGLAQLSKEEIEKRSREVHGDKYDYSLVNPRRGVKKIDIRCLTHGVFRMTPQCHFGLKQGCPECARLASRKPVFGVGINDYEGKVKIKDKHIPSYKVWHQLLKRLFCEQSLKKRPIYKEIKIYNDWLFFSKFKEWYDRNSQYHHEGWDLDKDVLCNVLGLKRKIYSPDTCIFLPPEINTALIVQKKRKSSLPLGVRFEMSGRYSARLQMGLSVRLHIGTFDTAEEAFMAYKKAKELRIRELAEKYKNELSPVAYAALLKYEVHEDGR